MKIIFGLGWAESRAKNHIKAFKEGSAATLFEKYRERISHHYSCEAVAMSFDDLKNQSGLIWICERSKKCKMLTSEDLALRFQKICDSGTKSLTIWIGPPDGLSPAQINTLHADLIWSFGPMTLPHELATVVASEQIYRAIAILNNHPYHSGH